MGLPWVEHGYPYPYYLEKPGPIPIPLTITRVRRRVVSVKHILIETRQLALTRRSTGTGGQKSDNAARPPSLPNPIWVLNNSAYPFVIANKYPLWSNILDSTSPPSPTFVMSLLASAKCHTLFLPASGPFPSPALPISLRCAFCKTSIAFVPFVASGF